MVEVPGPERIVEVEKTVERIVEVPVETIVERTVEVPVEKIVEVPVVDNAALERFRAENQGLRFRVDSLTQQIETAQNSQPVTVERPSDLRRAAELAAVSELNTAKLTVDQIYEILQKSSEKDVQRRLGFWAVPLPKNSPNKGKE